MKQKETKNTRILAGAVLLFANERDALRKCSAVNSRKITDQMRWYILQGLKQDGYLE